MVVARALLREVWLEGGLQRWRDGWYQWYGDGWSVRSEAEVREQVWLSMDRTQALTEADGSTYEQIPVNRDSVANVVEAMRAMTRVPYQEAPVWLSKREERGNARYCVAIGDKVVDLQESAKKGQFVGWDRGSEWFDLGVLPGRLGEKECPVWMKCLEQGGGGDNGWERLVKRVFGYAIMNTREFQRWVLLYGRVRGGKGTTCRMLKWLLGGYGYFETQLGAMVKEFGLQGCENSKVLCVTEVARDMRGVEAESATRLLKNLVGEDGVYINRKYLPPLQGVVLKALPILSSNEMLSIPDRAGGLTSKMVCVPYLYSWLGKEDRDLGRKLWEEKGAVANWALEGAVELMAETDPQKWFEMTEEGRAEVETMRELSNPADTFLAEHFTRNERNRLEVELVYGMYKGWMDRLDCRASVIPYNRFRRWLIENSSWGLREYRREDGERGIQGLGIRLLG